MSMDLRLSPFLRRALGVLLAVAGVVTVLAVTGLLLIDRWMRRESEPVLAALRKDTAANLDFFCEQQTLLTADPWFREPRTEGDAGPLLNAWMPWELRPAPKGSPLSIPAHLPQSYLDFQDWLSSRADLSTLDFGWMGQLHAYDRWDYLRNRPTPLREPFDLTYEPMPQFGHLILWARFRLLQGVRTGQPLAAAREVRHLAWLVYNTDTLDGAMVAAMLLDTERAAHASVQAPPPEWRPMSSEQVARMQAVIMSGFIFSYPPIAVEVARKSRRCGEPVSRCAAMTEAAFMAKILEPWARRKYREAYTALAEDLEAFPCATSLGKLIWQQGVTVDNGAADLLIPMPKWGRWLPRVHFGALLADRLLADGHSDLRQLHSFRRALATGDFEVESEP
jgi:hypothetical protein